MKKLLLVVDPQIDFISGTLPVGGAEEAMQALADYVRQHDGDYACKIVTTDWHPYRHCSFAPQGGPWPVHCVQNSVGAAIYGSLLEALNETRGELCILRKGNKADREEYSIFKNRSSALQIGKLIHKYAIQQIDICGLAGDICVLNTLKDGQQKYGKRFFHVLQQFSPSIDGGTALSQYLKQ